MDPHRLSCCTLIVAFLLISRPQDSLAVRLELDETNGRRNLNFDEPFRVALINNSNQPIRIWNPETEKGYYQFSFHFKNLRSGEIRVVRKRRIDDKKYWKSLENEIEPDSTTIEIAPKNTLTTEVELNDFAWGDADGKAFPLLIQAIALTFPPSSKQRSRRMTSRTRCGPARSRAPHHRRAHRPSTQDATRLSRERLPRRGNRNDDC